MRERDHERPDPFVNEYCSFEPFSWKENGGVLKPVVFKVVTEKLQSLGLRKNPSIMTFRIGEWIMLPDDELEIGNADQGGIWSALKLSGAKTLAAYMTKNYGVRVRIFLAMAEKPVYANSYRVKSQGVFLFEELNITLLK